MICLDCRLQYHEVCYDVCHGTDYRSCCCQHKTTDEGGTPG